MRTIALILLLVCIPCVASIGARGGLEAIAVSADGKRVAVGGQNRVVYILDGGLEVKERIYLGSRIGAMVFSKDGKRLAIEDENDTIRLLDVETKKVVAKVENVVGMVAHEDTIAVRDPRVYEGGTIRLLSLANLKEQKRLELTYRPAAWAFAEGGKQLQVLSLGVAVVKNPGPLKYPDNVTGLAKQEFRMKADGIDSVLELRDLDKGQVIEQKRLWYTSDSDSTVLVRVGKVVHVLNRGNICARIETGEVKLYSTSLFVNHAVGVSPDGSRLVVGGETGGYSGPLEGGKLVEFAIDPLSGPAEYFNRLFVLADGSAYGVTTAFRVARLSKDGKVEKVAAVY